MQGKATLGNHPIHPMLVTLPIGFFIGTVVCYIITWAGGDVSFWPRMAVMLMIFGLAGGLLSALFGFIDYATAPMSAAVKATATNHMLLNLVVVIAFAVAVWQGWYDHLNQISIWLSVFGVLVMACSGWLGGKLTFVGRVGAVESAPSMPRETERRVA